MKLPVTPACRKESCPTTTLMMPSIPQAVSHAWVGHTAHPSRKAHLHLSLHILIDMYLYTHTHLMYTSDIYLIYMLISVPISIYSHQDHTCTISIFHFPEQPQKLHNPSASLLRDVFLTIAIKLSTVLKMYFYIHVFLNKCKLQSDLKLITDQ